MCYAELGTERYWVKKEFVDECIAKRELLDDKDFISIKSNVRYFLDLDLDADPFLDLLCFYPLVCWD